MPEKSKVFITERDGDTLIVVPHGDGLGFRYADVQIEANNIRRIIGQPDVANLVIDLEQLDYFGSEGGADCSIGRPETGTPSF